MNRRELSRGTGLKQLAALDTIVVVEIKSC